jgi:hypothetical protein
VNVDEILAALNRRGVDYVLIGGMNFLLRHKPVLTFDVDVWVADHDANLTALNLALGDLGAAWGRTEQAWGPVGADPAWLRQQDCFCLTTRHGAVDVFREVLGLEGRYAECKASAVRSQTASGVPYPGLSDPHMLECQLALEPGKRSQDRITTLRLAIAGSANAH